MSASRRRMTVDGVLIALALVAAGAVLATRDRQTTEQRDDRADHLLVDFREEAISRVRFERAEGGFTLVAGEPDEEGERVFRLAEPVAEEAETFAVQKLLGTLQFATSLRRVEESAVDRAAFGLDAPELVVHVDQGEVRYRLRLGKEAASPIGARYLEIAGEGAPSKGVVLVDKGLVAELALRVDDLRERYVMPYLSTSLARLVLDGEGGRRALRRAGYDGAWRFDGMHADRRLARAALDRLLTQLARTRAERFLDPAEGERALAGGPRVEVEMHPLDAARPVGRVTVGGRCPGNDAEVVALRREPDRLAACVPRSVLSGLGMAAPDLVDAGVFWARADQIEGIEITRGELRLALDRKEGAFLLRAPTAGEVSAEAGSARLAALVRTTGTLVEGADARALGLEPPQGVAVLRPLAADEQKAAEATERVELGAIAPDGSLSVRRLHDGAILRLELDAARALSVDSSLLRATALLDVPLSDVAEIRVVGEVRQVLRRDAAGGMTLVEPPGLDVDATLALELCDALRGLSADRWVADRDDGSFGLTPPAATVTLKLRKGDTVTEHELRLGRRAGRGARYAQLDRDPGVFVAGRSLVETLSTWVVSRSAFTLDREATTRVTLRGAERELVLARRGEDFVDASAAEPLPDEQVARVIEALASLRAEGAVSIGPAPAELGFGNPLLEVRMELEAGRAAAPERERRFVVGATTTYRGIDAHAARLEGVDATFALPRAALRPLLDAL